MDSFYQQYRNGSASWGTAEDARAASLCSGRGFGYGNLDGTEISDASDSPAMIIGGSGSFKHTTLVAPFVLTNPGSTFTLDVKGEITACSVLAQTLMGKPQYMINPFGMHGLPSHTVGPLIHIRPRAATLEADLRQVAEALIVSSGSGNAVFFETLARSVLQAFSWFDVQAQGMLSLNRVKRMVDSITGDVQTWQSLARAIIATGNADVIATIDLITEMQAAGDRAFTSVMAELSNGLAFLTIPVLRDSISDQPDFTIESALCDMRRPSNVSLMIPFDLIGVCAPYMRLITSSVMITKSRFPSSPQITLLLDEALTLGRADFVIRAMQYARGIGLKVVVVVQDTSAIDRVYGPGTSHSFLNSAGTQIYVGIRDGKLASELATVLGNMSLHYPDRLQQERAALAKEQAVRAALQGGDLSAAILEARFQSMAAQHELMQSRPLASADELLRLRPEQGIVLAPGRGCPPLLVNRVNYFDRRSLAGKFLQNPYRQPSDAVDVRTIFGVRRRRQITERAPARNAHLPQHSDGYWTFVEGYRPKS